MNFLENVPPHMQYLTLKLAAEQVRKHIQAESKHPEIVLKSRKTRSANFEPFQDW